MDAGTHNLPGGIGLQTITPAHHRIMSYSQSTIATSRTASSSREVFSAGSEEDEDHIARRVSVSESLQARAQQPSTTDTGTETNTNTATTTNTTSNIDANSEQNVFNDLRPVSKSRQMTVLLSAFLTICVTIGFNQSYGVFQSVYVSSSDTILQPGEEKNTALVAFVGTLGAGLTWAGSIFVNPLMARAKSMTHVTVPGVLLMSLGFGLASLASTTWHLLLTQGLLFGVGSSMLYFPVLAVCPEYFAERRGTAMGIVMSGAGAGGVIFSPVMRALISACGVRWTLRFMALFVLVIALPIAVTAPPSRFTRHRVTHVDLKLATKPAFILSVMAALLQSSGNFIPLTFLSEFGLTLGYTASFGAAMIATNNGINSLSRIVTGFAGDRFGRQNILIVTITGSAVAVCGLWLASASSGSQSLWITFVVVYGVWAGGYNALFPTVISEVFGIQAYANVNGFISFVRGVGAFFGSPVGGVILGGENLRRNYLNVVYFDSALLFGASLCVVGVRYFDAREKGHWSGRA